VSAISTLQVSASLAGTLDRPELAVSSNLDRAIAERLRAMAGSGSGRGRAADARASRQPGGRAGECGARRVAALGGEVTKRLGAERARLDDARRALEQRFARPASALNFPPSPAGRHPRTGCHSDPIDLIRRAQQGDRAAFEALYRAHAGRVYALCLRLTADAAQAEERTQTPSFGRGSGSPRFRGESAFSSWLYRLTVNEVLLGRRAERRREQRIVTTDDPAALERPRGADSAPGSALDLERAVAALPPGAREVFVLHDVEGYRHEEIAALAGIAVGTSKAQLFRARRLLREALNR